MADDRNWDVLRMAEANALTRDWSEYRALAGREAGRFQVETILDASGFPQRLRELEADGGVLPPQPPTMRGRVGGLIVRSQQRLLWWVGRAFQLRDATLRSVYDAMLQISVGQMEREAQLREEIRALQYRLQELEKRLV